MKLTNKRLLTTITLVVLSATSALAAQTAQSAQSANHPTPANRTAAAPKASLAGLAKRLPVGNAKKKPLRTPAPVPHFGS